MKALKALILLTALAACQPPLEEVDPQEQGPVEGGLVEREPDICGASAYRTAAIGQPPSVIATLGITRKTRVIPLGGIVTQEYSPYRMNFYLDAAGNISRLSCG